MSKIRLILLILILQFTLVVENRNGMSIDNGSIHFNQRAKLSQQYSEQDFFHSQIFVDPSRSDFAGPSLNTAYSVSIDSTNNMVITGITDELMFPIINGFDNIFGGDVDGYLIKLGYDGEILWSTFIGGEDIDVSTDIDVDSEDNIVITGYTESTDFPTTSGSFSDTLNGSRDAFVSKFSPQGDLIWSTYLGGSQREGSIESNSGNSRLTIDDDNNIIVVGITASEDFPLVSPSQISYGGNTDLFVSKISPNGSLIWSTFVGGSSSDHVYDVKSDLDNNIIIGGSTSSSDFPQINPGDVTPFKWSGFVTKLLDTGIPVWTTIQGGELPIGTPFHSVQSLVIDSKNQIVAAANSGFADNGPTKDAYDKIHHGAIDIYITKYDTNGILTYASYYGGTSEDELQDMTMDDEDNLYITYSSPLRSEFNPVLNSYFSHNPTNQLIDIAYKPKISKFNSDNVLLWSTDYLSPTMESIIDGTGDSICGMEMDHDGRLLMVGATEHADLPGIDQSLVLSKGTSFMSIMKLDPLADEDEDDLLNYEEFKEKASPKSSDTDNDGLTDGEEVHNHSSDPSSKDTDSDGLEDLFEVQNNFNPTLNDTDEDLIPDGWEFLNELRPTYSLDSIEDPDDDGLNNYEEFVTHTDPHNADTDGDGMNDGYEVKHDLDPLYDDSSGNKDGDFFSNKFEHDYRGLRFNPNSIVDSVVITLILITSISVGTFYTWKRLQHQKTAKTEGFTSYKEKQLLNSRGFDSVEQSEEAMMLGFLTQLAKSMVNASGYSSIDEMVSGWNTQISEINSQLENLELVEIEKLVNSTTSPIVLHNLENAYLSQKIEIESLIKQIENSTFLQIGLGNLPKINEDLPFQNLDQIKLETLSSITEESKSKLESNYGQLLDLFESRKQWFIPWQPLLTLIQMTPDGIPIDLSKIAEVIQCPEDQAQDLLELLLEENKLIGHYNKPKKVYTKGTNISDYIQSMLAQLANFAE